MQRILAIACAVAALAIFLLVSLTWVVVDVRTEGGVSFFAPIPLEAAWLAIPWLRNQGVLESPPLDEEIRELLRKVVVELKPIEDAVLLELMEGEELVKLVKRGDNLELFVSKPSESVRVRAPLEAIERAIAEWDNHWRPHEMLAAVRSFASGFRLEVEEPDKRVRVWVW